MEQWSPSCYNCIRCEKNVHISIKLQMENVLLLLQTVHMPYQRKTKKKIIKLIHADKLLWAKHRLEFFFFLREIPMHRECVYHLIDTVVTWRTSEAARWCILMNWKERKMLSEVESDGRWTWPLADSRHMPEQTWPCVVHSLFKKSCMEKHPIWAFEVRAIISYRSVDGAG